MSKKPPDPSPPPKGSEEARFKSLLRKLVQVPKDEVDSKVVEHRKRRRRRS